MASLVEAQAFIGQFDKCLPLCERGQAVDVINALHTLNNITKASISQVRELDPGNGKDYFCSFLLEMELALELYLAPTPRLGTIEGGLPSLHTWSDDSISRLSNHPSALTKSKVKQFLLALGVFPSEEFETRSIAATVKKFLDCQVKAPQPVVLAGASAKALNLNHAPTCTDYGKTVSVSWADQYGSSDSEGDATSLADMPPLEDDDESVTLCHSFVQPTVVEISIPCVNAADEQNTLEDDCDAEYDGSDVEDEDFPCDEDAYTFLFARAIPRFEDGYDDQDSLGSHHFDDGDSKGRNVPRPTDAFYKTRICRNWEQTGSCQYGSRCTFAHGDEELRQSNEIPGTRPNCPELPAPSLSKPSTRRVTEDDDRSTQLIKTRMCQNYERSGVCKFGDKCTFAHGKDDLRSSLWGRGPTNAGGYKKRLCERFAAGSCFYGSRCTFAHGADDLQ